MSISANYPTVAPSLNLDFANSQQLDPRITFSRPTTAAYYDANTTALAEQNLFKYSQDFTQSSAWTLTAVTDSITGTAPDGTSTANSIVETATTNNHFIGVVNFLVSVTAGLPYTFSIYLKKGVGVTAPQYVQINAFSAAFNCGVVVDLNAGTIYSAVNSTLSVVSAFSTVSAGNGWYRVIFTATAVTNSTAQNIGTICFINNTPSLAAGNALPSYLGIITSDVQAWGFQIEQRSSVTAYNATTTTAITNYIPVLLSAPANQARFDHNPVTRESLGLLIEQQSTNLFLNSSDLSNSYWIKYTGSGCIIADYGIAPDGTLTADQFSLVTGASSNQGFYVGISGTTVQSYTQSIYVKPLDSQMYFALLGLDGLSTSYNLSTLAVTSGEGGTSTGTITQVGNGWYRLTRTATSAGGLQYPAFLAIPSYPRIGGSAAWTPTLPSRTLVWGQQFEATAFPTSYIPTVASQVIRSADNASMTGTNFSSWYNQSGGSFYMSGKYSGSTATYFGMLQVVGSSSLSLYATNTNKAEWGQLNSADITSSGVMGSSRFQVAMTAINNGNTVTGNLTLALNGSTSTSGTGGYSAPNSATTLNIGFSTLGYASINGTINKISYYPTILSSTNLIALTGS